MELDQCYPRQNADCYLHLNKVSSNRAQICCPVYVWFYFSFRIKYLFPCDSSLQWPSDFPPIILDEQKQVEILSKILAIRFILP